jgi:hypothetical protein
MDVGVRTEYDDGRRKWRAVLRPAEFEAAGEKFDLALHRVIMEPCGIGPRRHQADNHLGWRLTADS